MSKGWIKLHRRLQDHWLWNSQRFSKGQAWVDLLLLASHADHEVLMGNQPIGVKCGQVLTSQTRLAAKWLWTRKSVNAFLTLLKRDNQVDIRTSKETETGYTLITIKNYEKFQGSLSASDPTQETIRGDIGEPIRGTSEGHPRDTINKGKKGKNVTEPMNGSAHREILENYHQLFKAKFGTAPLFVGGRDGKIVSSLLQARKDSKEINLLLDLFFRIGTKYARETGRYDLPSFKASYNELLVLSTQGMS